MRQHRCRFTEPELSGRRAGSYRPRTVNRAGSVTTRSMPELCHSSRFDHEMTASSALPRERTFSGRASKSQRGLPSGSRCRCRFTNPSVEGCWTDAAAQAAVIAAHRHLFDQLPPPLQRQPARLENRKTEVGSRPIATYDLPPLHERGPLPLNHLHGAATPAAARDDDRRPPAPFVKRSAAHGLPSRIRLP